MPLGALACLVLRAASPPAGALGEGGRAGAPRSASRWRRCSSSSPAASPPSTTSPPTRRAPSPARSSSPIRSMRWSTRPLGAGARAPRDRRRAGATRGSCSSCSGCIAQLNPALPFFGPATSAARARRCRAISSSPRAPSRCRVAGFGLFVSVAAQGRGRGAALDAPAAHRGAVVQVRHGLRDAAAALLRGLGDATGASSGLAGGARGLRAAARARQDGAHLPRHRPHRSPGRSSRRSSAPTARSTTSCRLFRWPYGQLATFATLTRYIHEVWPVLALAWLIALFVWRARRADTMTAPTGGVPMSLLQAPRLLLPEPARRARGLLRQSRRGRHARLRQGRVKELGLAGEGKVRVNQAGCLDRCEEGPVHRGLPRRAPGTPTSTRPTSTRSSRSTS